MAQIAPESSIVTYGPEFFAQFNAITAEDILKRIPGIQDILTAASVVSTQRGFGAGGAQVLINGRRLSGKNNSVGAALQRIQARQVVRVEIIRGSVPGLDVRSEGMVVNVVLTDELSVGAGSWEGRLSHWSGGGWGEGLKTSYAADVGALNYIVGLQWNPRFDRKDRIDLLYVPGSTPFERQDEDQHLRGREWIGTGSLTYAFGLSDRISVNGRYSHNHQRDDIPSYVYALAPGRETYTGLFDDFREPITKSLEIGGDYEHAFAGGDTLQLLALYSSTDQVEDRTFSQTLPAAARALDKIQRQMPDRTEKIVRGTYRTPLTATQSVEVGVEGAQNTLDQSVRLLQYTNGVERDVPLFNPDSRVTENRLETFATYSWQPRPTFTVEAAADTEYSRLAQRGRDVNRTRSFFFVKPRLDVRYDLTSVDQLRGRIVRTISQLDFADFVSGFYTDDQTTDAIRAGNPNLVPEKQWSYNVTFEHRYPRDQGLVSLQAMFNDISDRIERIPAGNNASATGNIGAAHAYGLQGKVALRLAWLGLPGASVDATGTHWKTKATDPFTGEKRSLRLFTNDNWTLTFRNDTDWHNLAYGATWADAGNQNDFDFNYSDRNINKPTFSVFSEARVVRGLTARIDVSRVFLVGSHRVRSVYLGNRGLGRFRHIEERIGDFEREVKFTLRGTF